MVHNYKVSYYLLQNGANYQRPVFYRQDYSIPKKNRDPADKGKPVYLLDALKENVSETFTNTHKYKMLIVDFLKSKGIE